LILRRRFGDLAVHVLQALETGPQRCHVVWDADCSATAHYFSPLLKLTRRLARSRASPDRTLLLLRIQCGRSLAAADTHGARHRLVERLPRWRFAGARLQLRELRPQCRCSDEKTRSPNMMLAIRGIAFDAPAILLSRLEHVGGQR